MCFDTMGDKQLKTFLKKYNLPLKGTKKVNTGFVYNYYSLTTKNLGVTNFRTKSMPKFFSPKLRKMPKFCHT